MDLNVRAFRLVQRAIDGDPPPQTAKHARAVSREAQPELRERRLNAGQRLQGRPAKCAGEETHPSSRTEKGTIMSTVAASYVGSDIWNAEVYGTLSVAARTSIAVRSAHHLLATRWAYMRLNRHLGSFLDKFYSIFEDAQKGTLKASCEPPTPETVEKAVESLWNLHHSLRCVYDLSVRKGLKKKIILTKQVAELAVSIERLVDVIQWIMEMSNQESGPEIDAMVAAATEEYRRGETVIIR